MNRRFKPSQNKMKEEGEMDPMQAVPQEQAVVDPNAQLQSQPGNVQPTVPGGIPPVQPQFTYPPEVMNSNDPSLLSQGPIAQPPVQQTPEQPQPNVQATVPPQQAQPVDQTGVAESWIHASAEEVEVIREFRKWKKAKGMTKKQEGFQDELEPITPANEEFSDEIDMGAPEGEVESEGNEVAELKDILMDVAELYNQLGGEPITIDTANLNPEEDEENGEEESDLESELGMEPEESDEGEVDFEESKNRKKEAMDPTMMQDIVDDDLADPELDDDSWDDDSEDYGMPEEMSINPAGESYGPGDVDIDLNGMNEPEISADAVDMAFNNDNGEDIMENVNKKALARREALKKAREAVAKMLEEENKDSGDNTPPVGEQPEVELLMGKATADIGSNPDAITREQKKQALLKKVAEYRAKKQETMTPTRAKTWPTSDSSADAKKSMGTYANKRKAFPDGNPSSSENTKQTAKSAYPEEMTRDEAYVARYEEKQKLDFKKLLKEGFLG